MDTKLKPVDTDAEESRVRYLPFENRFTIFFKNHLREGALLRRHPSFALQYRLMRSLFRRLFPFMYVREGDTCIQVGCAEWMLDFGVSMSLIFSVLTGPRGRVIVVEPDQRNLDALARYIAREGVKNITVVKKAAWREHTTGEFTFYEDNTGSNIVSEVERAAPWKGAEMYQNRPKRVERVEMDTIDNICRDLGVKPDFINLTINAAELDVIKGMPETLERGAVVTWLFGDRWWWREAIRYLQERGYRIVAANSSYSHRMRSVNGRPNVASFKVFSAFQDVMYAAALPEGSARRDPREFDAVLGKLKDFKFSVTPAT